MDEDEPDDEEPNEDDLEEALDYLSSIDPEVLRQFGEAARAFTLPEGFVEQISKWRKVTIPTPLPLNTVQLLSPASQEAIRQIGVEVNRNLEPVRQALAAWQANRPRVIYRTVTDSIDITDTATAIVTPGPETTDIDLGRLIPAAVAGLTSGAWLTMLERLPATDPKREMLGVLMGIAWSWLFAVLYQSR